MSAAIRHTVHEADPAEVPAVRESFVDRERRRGRGTQTNRGGRFEPVERVEEDDGWGILAEAEAFKTEVAQETARKIITRNQSPDISFDRSINAYRGCEHGCVYCFARPTHAFLGLSPGLDFETKLTAKSNAAALLERELAAPDYEVRTMAMGTNTDPYQPIERRYGLTRSILEVLERTRHPVGIVTKSTLVLRDRDILGRMSSQNLAKVAISITTLDGKLARKMEPRAPSPAKRLEAVRLLAAAGIPVTVMVAPILPGLTDDGVERVLEAAKDAGAREAGYVLLRLPYEIKELFQEWMVENYPDRLRRVLSSIRSTRGGKLYDAEFGTRQVGDGPIAWAIGRRFELAARRLGLNQNKVKLRTDLFERPALPGEQLSLF